MSIYPEISSGLPRRADVAQVEGVRPLLTRLGHSRFKKKMATRARSPRQTSKATLSDMAVLAGRVEEDLEHIRKAFRLNPFPASWYYLTLGQAQYAAGEYEAAVETLRRDETYRTSSRRFLAASLAQLGRLDERAQRPN